LQVGGQLANFVEKYGAAFGDGQQPSLGLVAPVKAPRT
jgi:hypothetical protein